MAQTTVSQVSQLRLASHSWLLRVSSELILVAVVGGVRLPEVLPQENCLLDDPRRASGVESQPGVKGEVLG